MTSVSRRITSKLREARTIWRCKERSIGGPLPQAVFCPTGGITPDNYRDYLALDNVACVGGSWLAPAETVAARDWARITSLAAEVVARSPA